MIGLLFEDSNDITNKILKNKKIKLIEKIDYTNIEKELLNNEVNCFLKINKNEKIINLSDVDFTGSNMVCVQYGNWKNKENRLYGSFKFENKLSQDIILESSKSNKIFISEDYYLAKKNFENKDIIFVFLVSKSPGVSFGKSSDFFIKLVFIIGLNSKTTIAFLELVGKSILIKETNA